MCKDGFDLKMASFLKLCGSLGQARLSTKQIKECYAIGIFLHDIQAPAKYRQIVRLVISQKAWSVYAPFLIFSSCEGEFSRCSLYC